MDERARGIRLRRFALDSLSTDNRSLAVSIVAAAAYAFSHAFILHATSTAEPMVGLFWSFLSFP
jgi:hypothetical protein